jgi:hypothetical protein
MVLSLTLMAGLFAAPASSLASPANKVDEPHVVSIPANGTMTLKARGFCMEFGKPFPTGTMAPNGLAPANIRGGLTYAIDKGYTDSNAQQVQLAIWNLADGTWHNADHVIGSEIVSNTTTVTPPTANALALSDAFTQKSVSVSAKFVPQTADAFYGDGDVVITNTTGSALSVYMPIGTAFTVPNGNGQFQDLVAYELVQAEGTPTAAATTSPAATTTTAATSVATTTPAASATAVATVTTAATIEATTTTAVATAEPTVTTAPTVEVATSTPEATATTVTQPLPATGGGDAGGTTMMLMLIIGLVMSSLGLVLKFRKA